MSYPRAFGQTAASPWTSGAPPGLQQQQQQQPPQTQQQQQSALQPASTQQQQQPGGMQPMFQQPMGAFDLSAAPMWPGAGGQQVGQHAAIGQQQPWMGGVQQTVQYVPNPAFIAQAQPPMPIHQAHPNMRMNQSANARQMQHQQQPHHQQQMRQQQQPHQQQRQHNHNQQQQQTHQRSLSAPRLANWNKQQKNNQPYPQSRVNNNNNNSYNNNNNNNNIGSKNNYNNNNQKGSGNNKQNNQRPQQQQQNDQKQPHQQQQQRRPQQQQQQKQQQQQQQPQQKPKGQNNTRPSPQQPKLGSRRHPVKVTPEARKQNLAEKSAVQPIGANGSNKQVKLSRQAKLKARRAEKGADGEQPADQPAGENVNGPSKTSIRKKLKLEARKNAESLAQSSLAVVKGSKPNEDLKDKSIEARFGEDTLDQAQLRCVPAVFGFVCKLCDVFLRDKIARREHIESGEHVEKFKVFEEAEAKRLAQEQEEARKAELEAVKNEPESTKDEAGANKEELDSTDNEPKVEEQNSKTEEKDVKGDESADAKPVDDEQPKVETSEAVA